MLRIKEIELVLFRLDYLFGAIIIVSQAFGWTNTVSNFFYGTFFVTLMLWLCVITVSFEKLDLLALLIVGCALLSVLVSGIQTGAHFSFNYLKKYIMFCCTIIFFSVACKLSIDEKTTKFLGNVAVCIGVVLLLMYVTRNAQMHVLNDRLSNYLVFGFSNPNTTALFLSCMVMLLLFLAREQEKIYRKLIFWGLAGIEIWFLFQTQSRNSLLVTVLFLSLYIFTMLRKQRLIVKRWILWLVAVFPILFAIVYLEIVDSEWVGRVFSFLVSEGKGMNSRVRIWGFALRAFYESPLFGAYSQISNGTGMSQLHNSHVDILVSYGIFVLILTCIFLFCVMRRMQQESQNKLQDLALISFICALFLGIGEAALFSGGLGIYLYAGVFLAMKGNVGELEESNENCLHE